MSRWVWPHFRALGVDELQTIGFWFGLGAVTFWMLSAVFIRDAPPPRPELVAIVAGLLLQRVFHKETTDVKSDGPVSKVVARGSSTGDERGAPDDHGDGARADRVRWFHLPSFVRQVT